MAATKEEIRAWLSRGKDKGNSHMIVACDTFDHHDYPVFVDKSEDINERVEKIKTQEMTRVMEVYSYDMDLQQQLGERRAYNLENIPGSDVFLCRNFAAEWFAIMATIVARLRHHRVDSVITGHIVNNKFAVHHTRPSLRDTTHE